MNNVDLWTVAIQHIASLRWATPRYDAKIDRNEKHDNLRCFQSFVCFCVRRTVFFLCNWVRLNNAARCATKHKWYAWLALRMQIEAIDRCMNKKMENKITIQFKCSEKTEKKMPNIGKSNWIFGWICRPTWVYIEPTPCQSSENCCTSVWMVWIRDR